MWNFGQQDIGIEVSHPLMLDLGQTWDGCVAIYGKELVLEQHPIVSYVHDKCRQQDEYLCTEFNTRKTELMNFNMKATSLPVFTNSRALNRPVNLSLTMLSAIIYGKNGPKSSKAT